MRAHACLFLAGSALSLLWTGANLADDQRLVRTELAKLGKAATALVELGSGRTQVFGQQSYGSAFCIHGSGLFITNEHVIHPRNQFGLGNQQGADAQIMLVVNPGQKNEKSYPARVIRIDKQLDLALLRIEGMHHFPKLSLGDDKRLEELMDVVAFGFPYGANLAGGDGSPQFGRPMASRPHDYPSVSVNAGSITALRYKDGNLDRIQLDATINPGNSGGPVLDKDGKVVGVVVSIAVAQNLGRTGISHAIPVSHLARFVSRPEVEFDPPVLTPGNIYKPVQFEAKVVPMLPSSDPLSVDLILKPEGGQEHSYHMQGAQTTYRVSAVPLARPSGSARLRLLAQFDNGLLNATTMDAAVKLGDRSVQLSEIRSLQRKPAPHVTFYDGKAIDGSLSDFDAVPVQLGDQSLSVNLTKAVEVKFAPAIETDQLWYTLLVRQGGNEILRQTESLAVQGFLPAPAAATESTATIRPPMLERSPCNRKLPASLADVAVGGGGRYLVLHLPSLHQLAIFDVSAAEIVGHIPIKEDNARFAVGLEHVVVLSPGAGTIERWNLKALTREVSTNLPISGVLKGVAMGSASKGPMLVHWAAGTQELGRASFALIDIDRMRLIDSQINVHGALGNSYRDLVHLRASANGKVFGMWCTSHFPSGIGVIVASGTGAESYYAHSSAGFVVPSPDGKWLYTRLGRYAPEVSLTQMQPPEGEAGVPACHGDYYLSLPPLPNAAQRRTRPLRPQGGSPPAGQTSPEKTGTFTVRALGNEKPIARFGDLNLTAPLEESIKNDLTFDKRVYLIPEARLVITIPASNDQLVLNRFGG
jgi:hypothetical protein